MNIKSRKYLSWLAALGAGLGIATAANAVTKPLAVWNADFNDAATRNGVMFDANGNTVNDDGTVTISSSGSGGIKFTVDRTYDYITTVFTVKNLDETAASDRVLVALGGSTGYYTGVYLKSGGLSTGGVNGTSGAWGTTTYDGTVSSVADANTTRTFAATQVNAGTLQNGFHLYEDVGNGTSGGTIVYGGNGNNGLYGTQTYDKVLIGGGLSGSTGSLASMTDLVVVSVAIYVSDDGWPLDSAGRQNFAMPGSFPVSYSTSISVLNSLLTQASITDPMFVNLGATVYLTADATPASNLVFPYDTTIALDGTTLTVTGGMPVKLGSSITAVTGSGTVVAVGGTEINALPSGAFSSDAWTGTVWLKGRTGWSNFDPTAYGNAGSTLRFSGIQGHFSKKQCLLADTPAIELENDSYTYALNLNNGYSFNSNGGWSYVHTSELKGSGILQCDGSGGALIVVSSKWSDFTGSLKMANKTIWFGYETAPASDTDYTPGTVAGGIRIASGCKLTLPGDMTNWNVAGGYFGPGTIEISSHNSTSDVPVYLLGTDAETTIVLKGLTGTHHVLPFADHTISAKVQLDGAVTINSGSTGRTYTFSKLTGSGNFTNTFNEYFVFNDVSEYTGVLSCNKDSYKITAGLPTAPAVGDLIAKVDSTNNKVSSLVSLAGSAGALTGELKTVDSTYGLYAVAKATVGKTGYSTVAAALDAATASDDVVANLTGETVSVDSITAASLTVNGGGTINVTGDVNVSGAIAISDIALTVGGDIEAATLTMNPSNIDGRNRMNASSGGMPIETSVTAAAINAQVSGSGKVTATGDVTIGNDTTTSLIGSVNAANATTGAGTVTLYGANSVSGTLTVSEGSTIVLGDPYSLGTIARNYDASSSTVVTDENNYVTSISDLSANAKTAVPTVASVVTVLEGDSNTFGGRKVFSTSTSKLAETAKFESTSTDLTTFMVWKNAAGATSWNTPLNDSQSKGGSSYQITTANNGSNGIYKFRNGSTYNDSNYIFSNGVGGGALSADEQCLTVCGNWMLNTSGNSYMQFGSAVSGSAIAQVLMYKKDFTHAARSAIEAALMAKWGVGGVAYTPLSTTSDVVMKAGSTINLGGLAQTVKSISGSGTVQNGTLTVTAAINLSAGDVLTLPNTAEFTLGTVAAKIEDTTAGTVTLCGSLADALSAYSTGTLTILQSLTDVNLGTTETSITGIVLADGVSAPTFAANPPYSASYTDGTIANARVASTYVWTPADASTDWASLSNWRIGEAVPVALPGSSDEVSFTTSCTVKLSSTVQLAKLTIADGVRVCISADSLTAVELGDYGYGDTSTLALANICLYPISKTSYYSLEIGGIIEIVAETSNEMRANATRVDGKNKPTHTLNVSGSLTGTGTVAFRAMNSTNRSTITLGGDNSDFEGTANIVGDHSLFFVWDSAASGSAKAAWTVKKTEGNFEPKFGFTTGTIYFGSMDTSESTSVVSITTATRSTDGVVVEIGALNSATDVFEGSWADGTAATGKPSVRKVGSGALTAAFTDTAAYILNGGSLILSSSDETACSTEMAGCEVVSTTDTEAGTTTYTLLDRTASTWVGGASGDWNTASNWSNGVVPTDVTTVTFPAIASDAGYDKYTVTVSNNGWDPWINRDKCRAMVLNAALTLTGADGYLAVYGDITGDENASLTLNSVGLDNASWSPAVTVNITCPFYIDGSSSASCWFASRDVGFNITTAGAYDAYHPFNIYCPVTFGTLTVGNGEWINIGANRSLTVTKLVVADGATATLSPDDATATATVTAYESVTLQYSVTATPDGLNTRYTSALANVVPGTPTSFDSETAANNASVVLTDAQEAQGLSDTYYTTVIVHDEETGKYVVTAVLNESVVGGILVGAAELDASSGEVTISVPADKLKPGLCYRVVSGASAGALTTKGTWSEYYDGVNAPELTATLPSGGVLYYTLQASDDNTQE